MLLLGKVRQGLGTDLWKQQAEATSGLAKSSGSGRETSLKWVQVKIKELRIDNRKDFVKNCKMYVIKGLREMGGCWKGKQIKKGFCF